MRYTTLATLAIMLGACGTNVPDEESDLDLVVTAPAEGFRFEETRTYALPDTVVRIENPEDASTNTGEDLNASLSQFVLDTIANQMEARGYTRSAAAPDLFLEVSSMSSTSTEVYYDYWPVYWGGYYAPLYGVSYGVGWSAGAVPYVIETTVGSLIINATDPKSDDEDAQVVPTVWVAVVNGIVDGSSTSELQGRLDDAIKQAFEQSPYLRSGNP